MTAVYISGTEHELAKLMAEYGPKWGFDVPDGIDLMAGANYYQLKSSTQAAVPEQETTASTSTKTAGLDPASLATVQAVRDWLAEVADNSDDSPSPVTRALAKLTTEQASVPQVTAETQAALKELLSNLQEQEMQAYAGIARDKVTITKGFQSGWTPVDNVNLSGEHVSGSEEADPAMSVVEEAAEIGRRASAEHIAELREPNEQALDEARDAATDAGTDPTRSDR